MKQLDVFATVIGAAMVLRPNNYDLLIGTNQTESSGPG